MERERNYDFRARIDIVHPPRRDPDARPSAEETVIESPGWAIHGPADPDPASLRAAHDLRDYFEASLGLPLAYVPGGAGGAKTIFLALDPGVGRQPAAFSLAVEKDRIAIAGRDPRGLWAGAIHLEDRLSLRGGPFLAPFRETREKLVPLRMVHSGWGIDNFPDSHLNAIAHAGFDAVVLFVKGPDLTPTGPRDFNDLIRRAARHGLGVMFYSYLPSWMHPDDPAAPEFFDRHYTQLFAKHPEALGLMLVGESGEFPSRDPAVAGKRWNESFTDGIPDPKPSPGWWPCSDYPQWLVRIRDAVRKAAPQALVVFNTYNWGYVPVEARKRFIDSLPEGVTPQATFEMFKSVERENATCAVMDYSISADEPGDYFATECANAHARGSPVLATANTAGATWDFGCVPYVPAPQQWIRRFLALDKARRDWGVDKYYDNHHYGWWPSVATDLGRWFFSSPQADLNDLLPRLAARDFGAEAAGGMVAAWDCWSRAMRHFTPTNEDQYGPFRVGPAYPFIFHPNVTRTMSEKEIRFPADPNAHFGHRIIKTFYQPYENINQAPGNLRYPIELRSLERMRELWEDGIGLMERAVERMPAAKRGTGARELNLGRFILTFIRTGIHIKRWWLLNMRLFNAATAGEGVALIDELEALAQREIANAQSALPLVDADSRLGWEPSMEYVADRRHIEWKLRQMRAMLDGDMEAYRRMLRLVK